MKSKIKDFLVSALKSVGLYIIVRSLMIRLGLHTPTPHGHSLLVKAIDQKVGEPGNIQGLVCIEIGSTRELLPEQGSTAEIAKQCQSKGVHFITVDMDPENTRMAENTLKGISPSFKAVNDKGESFLKSYEGKVDFLYLDAFDIDHGRHSKRRKQRYIEHLGSDIDNDACYKMHLDCAIEAAKLVDNGGVIVFDDAWREGESWGGKGLSAMPYLLEHGFRIVEETSNTIWLERNSTQ